MCFALFVRPDYPALAAPLPAQGARHRGPGRAEVGRRAALLCFPRDPVHHSDRLPEQQGAQSAAIVSVCNMDYH